VVGFVSRQVGVSVACLRILQAALVYVNTLLLQDVLAEPEWADLLTDHDRRGLTPLFWQHILPYGEVKLDMTTRLDIRTDAPTHRRTVRRSTIGTATARIEA